jgi:hypothetical protein
VTQFFALREDLLPIFAEVESRGPLRYARFDRYLEPRFSVYSSGTEIPNLSVATSGNGCASYLVYQPPNSLILRTIIETDRYDKPIRETYRLDQLENPDTIVFSPGGLWKGEILLYGSVGTVPWTNESAKKLRARFQCIIRKRFKRVGSYYVAAAALEMLKAGKRLTIAEQSPKEFDLSPDQIK